MNTELAFDIIVVGGGHAGSEAAFAAARMGCRTALVSFSRESVGQMSCNPAIGGLGKGQLVKEVDALFGEMGLATDETGIQFRTLNLSKGPAVRSSRAQADRDLYKARILRAVEHCPNLTLLVGEATGLLRKESRVTGVELADGSRLRAQAVILTTGTFLRGLMHTGESKERGGRVNDRASYALSDSINSLGLRMGRMKTGTPPRLRRSTIDFSVLAEQPGDTPIRPFSFRTAAIERPQISCWITSTTQETHDIISANVSRSPMFNGQIASIGPRYCPSIEDKVVRFQDKPSHNIFLEPEGFDSDIVYPNGISTSLPADVQERFVRSIRGLEAVEFIRFGYAVEYDFVDPTELERSLKVRSYSGLYLAGQINGTSGYEEAGAQGLIAGINAALSIQGREPFILRRDQAYIAVMIDDLTTLGVTEPYRMFTSRAEYRLHLREDNADARLTPFARQFGLVGEVDWGEFCSRQERVEREKNRLEATFIKPTTEVNEWLSRFESTALADAVSLSALLRRPEIRLEQIGVVYPPESPLRRNELERIETGIKFEGYLKRQNQDIERLKRMEGVRIPQCFDYTNLKNLSIEVRQKLSAVRPETLGQAGRISGVTQSALSLIAIYLRRGDGKNAELPTREII